MRYRRYIFLTVTLAIILQLCNVTSALADECDTVVVVVAKENPITDISLKQLRHLYTGETITFAGNTRIELMEHACCFDFFYQTVLQKTIGQVRKFWLRNIFSSRDCIPPVLFKESGKLLSRIIDNKGAIGFLPISDITDVIKVISIDGKQPIDSGYVLINCIESSEEE